jgi:hypothetical protein
LVIQSPERKINQFKPDFLTGEAVVVKQNDSLTKMATAFYQTAAWLIKNAKYKK